MCEIEYNKIADINDDGALTTARRASRNHRAQAGRNWKLLECCRQIDVFIEWASAIYGFVFSHKRK